MNSKILLAGVLMCGLSAAGCGTSSPADSGTVTDTGTTTDTGTATDTGTTGDTGVASDAAAGLVPCANASDFVAGTAIAMTATNTYSPACLRVAVGATVTWSGSFVAHPLTPSTRGSTPNPIPTTNTGTTATAMFPTAGLYPYFCLIHGTNDGVGMAGVIQVGP